MKPFGGLAERSGSCPEGSWSALAAVPRPRGEGEERERDKEERERRGKRAEARAVRNILREFRIEMYT